MIALNELLVARDFSSVSDRALRYALDLAARTGARLHVLYAEVLHDLPSQEDRDRSPAHDLDEIREKLKQDERAAPPEELDAVSVVETVERDVAAGPAILGYADAQDIDLITLGTHGRRGPSRVLIGSVAEEVVRRATQPVLTVRGAEEKTEIPPVGTVDRILVPIDFSKHARESLSYAKELALLYGARIDLLHVIEETLHPAFYVGGVQSIYDVEPNIEEKAVSELETFASETEGPDVEVEAHVMPGKASSSIIEFVAENDVDLVCSSTHGRTGLERFFLGSVAEKIVRHVRCPVLTVKAFGKSLLSTEPSAHRESEGA